ncbi:MAG: hypothetical protein V7785_12330 [Bermanella sp.]
MRLAIITLAFISQISFAQTLQDVIYKKDGSVLRGNLIEQDFTNGTYKIQLMGGSVFSITKEEIDKITKEKPFNNTVQTGSGININVENNPSINQAPVVTQEPVIKQTSFSNTYIEPPKKESRHSIRIGSMSKDITDSDDNGIGFTGINIAYQYNFDEHFSIYTEYNNADLNSEIIDGDNYYISSYQKDNYSFYGSEVSAMLSTNNFQGWQFYAGLGAFSEKFTRFGESETISGAVVTLGMGYSWQTLQLNLRVSGHGSDDYKSTAYNYGDDDVSATNIAFQLGFNF